MDYVILLSSIVLGALSVFLLHLDEPRHLKPLNAFTGAYLLSLTFLHLLPELYETGHGDFLLIGILILAGFYLQVALDVVSQGVEHGHTHHLPKGFPIGILAGLWSTPSSRLWRWDGPTAITIPPAGGCCCGA